MCERTAVITEYRCPGQERPISRAVHLGRMAVFYPGCRTCTHRDDTGALSPRQIKRLRELRDRAPRDLWSDSGVTADSINALPPAVMHRIGATFGTWLARQGLPHAPPSSLIPHPSSLLAVLAGDGRPTTARAAAALSEGLRWADVAVLDVGAATAGCAAFAVRHFQAAGGLLIGNPAGTPHGVGVRFFGPSAAPLATAEQLRPVKELYERGVDRPTRRSADCRRVDPTADYYAQFADLCHGLRPLRFVAASTSAPWLNDVRQLLQGTACTVVPGRGFVHELTGQIRAEHAHFGIHVFDDGQDCRLFDEQGAELPPDRLRLADQDSDALAVLLLLMQRLSRGDRLLSKIIAE
ncbi:MAG: hypothetical protein JXB10_06810 [Pirellulales bacterium]|nr:hypothetical protein [Pirellulales bacterium]